MSGWVCHWTWPARTGSPRSRTVSRRGWRCSVNLDALPPGEREALELRVIDQLAYDQVAHKLEIRPAAARLRVSRALRRLARTVPKEEP